MSSNSQPLLDEVEGEAIMKCIRDGFGTAQVGVVRSRTGIDELRIRDLASAGLGFEINPEAQDEVRIAVP